MALRKLAWSYHNGHTATCPTCKAATIPARHWRTLEILKTSKCDKCGEVFELVVPEDPDRVLTQTDLDRLAAGVQLRNMREHFLRGHPEVLFVSISGDIRKF